MIVDGGERDEMVQFASFNMYKKLYDQCIIPIQVSRPDPVFFCRSLTNSSSLAFRIDANVAFSLAQRVTASSQVTAVVSYLKQEVPNRE